MPTFLRTAVLCLAVLAGGVASTAQTSPQPAADDPEANLVSELVVTAR
eukprot:gene21607-27473_t